MKTILLLLFSTLALLGQEIHLTAANEIKEDTLLIALDIDIPNGFHLYANPLGPGIGKALTISVDSSNTITWLKATSNKPEKFTQDEQYWVWQWSRKATIYIKGIVKKKGDISTTIHFDGLMCKESCIPQIIDLPIEFNTDTIKVDTYSQSIRKGLKESVTFPLTITSTSSNNGTNIGTFESSNNMLTPPTNGTISSNTQYSPIEASTIDGTSKVSKFNIVKAIILAFIAGIILNFMPCVLPVLGIKILSFSEGREGDRSVAIKNSLAFAIGMVSIFVILGFLAAFLGLSWGEQFQNPIFTIVLISAMFVFSLGMFDLFIILVPNKISEMDMKQDSHSFIGNVSKGMFATILATPCSGPLLGATLAWTLTQPKAVIFAVFISLGLGMASPYVLLASSKKLSSLIPKPGKWMETFKEILGFFLIGFSIYLMVSLPQDLVLPTIGFQLVLLFIVRFYGKIAPFGAPLKNKVLAILFVILSLFVGYRMNFVAFRNIVAPRTSEDMWVSYTPQKLEQAHQDNKIAIVDFTALWCMNCQFNKKRIYETEKMAKLTTENNIVTLKADLTNKNEIAEKLRTELGSESIPFVAIFPPDDPYHPIIFRDIVNPNKFYGFLNSLLKK